MRKKICLGLVIAILSLSIVSYSLAIDQPRLKPIGFNIILDGTPDVDGNHIRNLTVSQNKGGVWIERGNLTYETYDANDEIEGIVNQSTRFEVVVFLNYSYADSTSESDWQTEVRITVTGELSGVVFTAYDYGLETTPYDEVQYWVIYYRYDWDSPDTVKTYDVEISYYVRDTSRLGDPKDLDEYVPDDERFWDMLSTGSRINSESTWLAQHPGFTPEDTYNYIVGQNWGGTWGDYVTGGEGYWKKTGWWSLNSDDQMTWVIWFIVADGGNATSYGHLVFHDETGYGSGIYVENDDIKWRLKQGTWITANILNVINCYQVYCAIGTWDRTYNSGKLNLTVYNLETGDIHSAESASGKTGNYIHNLDPLCFGSHDTGKEWFEGVFLDVKYYDGYNFTNQDMLDVFNDGVGSSLITTNIQNSWSFDEMESGLYDEDEQTLHDGLDDILFEAEDWNIDLIIQSISQFILPNWYEDPYFFMFIFSCIMMIVSPLFMVRVVKLRKDASFIFSLFIWMFLFIIGYTLMLTSIYGC